jgi:hypothetical protein
MTSLQHLKMHSPLLGDLTRLQESFGIGECFPPRKTANLIESRWPEKSSTTAEPI